ncbi:MAG: alkaline phosphatase family protein [Acidobacteriota bacterium]
MSRTLLIGLDGATFTVLDALMDRGLMPALKRLCDGGVRAGLMSTANPLTPLAWTSLLTGRSPGHHGIFDFVRVEQLSYHPHFRLATSSDIRCPTIYTLIGAQGLRSISLNFPVMFPPRPINGFLIPGFVPHRHLQRAMHPRELYDRLSALPEITLKELPVDFEDERRSVQVLAPERHEEWIRFHIRRERQWFNVLSHLMQTEPWDLASVVFDGVDKLQHACWRFIDDGLFASIGASAWAQRVRELCLDYFRQLDDLIARAIELAGSETRVFLASDHGFGPSDEIFYVNSWLAEQGFLAWKEDAPVAPEGYINTEGMKAAAFLFDWSRTNAYTLTPGSNGIYLRPGGAPGAPALSDAERASLRRRIIDGLMQVRNPGTGERVVRRVMTREEAFPGPHSGLAADLTLVLRDYGFVSVTRSDAIIKTRKEVAGVHNPRGIFLAAGPGIRRGAVVGDLSILDVTPALMHSLGRPVPEEFEGRLPLEIFADAHAMQPAALAAVAAGAASPTDTAAAGLAAMEAGMDAEGEATVMERLRALGYIE